jgi:hypothetical protein
VVSAQNSLFSKVYNPNLNIFYYYQCESEKGRGHFLVCPDSKPIYLSYESTDNDCCGESRRAMGAMETSRNLQAVTDGKIASGKIMANFIPTDTQTNFTVFGSGRSDFLCPRPQQYGDSNYPLALESGQQYDVYVPERPPRVARVMPFQMEEDTDFVILSLHFPIKADFRPFVNGRYQTDWQLDHIPDGSTGLHGEYMTDPSNGTIHVLLRGPNPPTVFLQTIDVVEAEARLDIPIKEFDLTRQFSFRVNVATVLGIALGRVQITGMRSGSTIVNFLIKEDPPIPVLTEESASAQTTTTTTTT